MRVFIQETPVILCSVMLWLSLNVKFQVGKNNGKTCGSFHFTKILEQSKQNKIMVCCVGIPEKIGWNYITASC